MEVGSHQAHSDEMRQHRQTSISNQQPKLHLNSLISILILSYLAGQVEHWPSLAAERLVAADRLRSHQRQQQHQQQPLDKLVIESYLSEQHQTGHRKAHRQHHSKKSTRTSRQRRFHGDFYESAAADRPVVVTSRGAVRGVTQKLFTGKSVDAFLGIPFAEPPVNQYRFRHPQPKKAWQGEWDASRLPSSCYQVNDTFFGSSFLGTSIWNANTPLSEDCLYLNIWTPFAVANTTLSGVSPRPGRTQTGGQSRRPVLVWIFGGGFYSGTSSLAIYEGGVLASEQDLIVVSLNYRVSALGFLYLGRPEAPGNAGLFDQLMALQWISDNIDQFGGDPTRVTLFGESAGAVSVALHLLSPLSRDLFQQAIMQSGAATCPWGVLERQEILANGMQLAQAVKCPAGNESQLEATLECLLRAEPMSLVSQEVGQTNSIINFPFVPLVDGAFLVESPAESLAKSNFKRAKILLGSNYDEGNAYLVYLSEYSHCPSASSGSSATNAPQSDSPAASTEAKAAPRPSSGDDEELAAILASGSSGTLAQRRRRAAQADNNFDFVGRQLNTPTSGSSGLSGKRDEQKPCRPIEELSLSRSDTLGMIDEDLNPYAKHPIARQSIIFEYSNWNNLSDSVSNYDALDKLVGDYYFTCNVNEFAQRYADSGNQVFMYYFKQRASTSPWPKWMGVLHGDEISFVFGEPLNQQFNYTSKERDLSRRMMTYWANFAKFGNPTRLGENESMEEKWPEYADRRQYFELHGDFIRIGRGPRAKQCAFWSHYLPKLIEQFDRSQCPANKPLRHPHIHPTILEPASLTQRTSLLSNIPSALIISLSLVLVLTIIGLLIYAKRSWNLDLSLSSSGSSD